MAELDPRFRTYFRSLRLSVRSARVDARGLLADLAEAGVGDHHRAAVARVESLLDHALASLEGLNLEEVPRARD